MIPPFHPLPALQCSSTLIALCVYYQLQTQTVEPKRGRALVWPSVLNEYPNECDDRTEHAALPVLAGEKYGANVWIHQRNFKESHKKQCS